MIIRKRGRRSVLFGVALAVATSVATRQAHAADQGQDTVWLQWEASTDADVDGYIVWRCAGFANQCPTNGAHGVDGDPRWTRMATFLAKDACAQAPCRGKLRDRLRAPLSYAVVAVRGTATSPASNVVTLMAEPVTQEAKGGAPAIDGRSAADATPDNGHATTNGQAATDGHATTRHSSRSRRARPTKVLVP